MSVFAQQVGRVIVSLALARLLGPRDYGVIAQAGIYLALMAVLLDQGLGSALIQRPELEVGTVGSVLWANMIAGSVVAALTVAGAPLLATLFHTPPLTAVLRWLSIDVLLTAASVVPQALVMRALRFRRLAFVEIVGLIAGGTAAVVTAVAGGRYWSLVALALTQDIVTLAALLWTAGRLEWRGSVKAWRSMWRFSLNLFGFQILNFVSRNADNVIVGNRLGRVALADYALSYRTMMQPIQMLGWLVNRVAFPLYSRLQDDRDRLRVLFLKSTRIVGIVSFPSMALVVVLAPALVPAVFGTAWRPAVVPMQVLAITGMRQSVLTLVGPVFMATGRTDRLFRWQAVSIVAYLTCFLVGVHWGITGVAVAYTATGLVLMPGELLLLSRTIPLSARDYLGALWPSLVVGAAAGLGASALTHFEWVASPFGRSALAAGGGTLAAFLVARVGFSLEYTEALSMARSLLRPSPYDETALV